MIGPLLIGFIVFLLVCAQSQATEVAGGGILLCSAQILFSMLLVSGMLIPLGLCGALVVLVAVWKFSNRQE
jgi:hypothetical protein